MGEFGGEFAGDRVMFGVVKIALLGIVDGKVSLASEGDAMGMLR